MDIKHDDDDVIYDKKQKYTEFQSRWRVHLLKDFSVVLYDYLCLNVAFNCTNVLQTTYS